MRSWGVQVNKKNYSILLGKKGRKYASAKERELLEAVLTFLSFASFPNPSQPSLPTRN